MTTLLNLSLALLYWVSGIIDLIDVLFSESYWTTLTAFAPFSVLWSRSDYWKQRLEADDGQETDNAHLISARIRARGGPITAADVNAVLASQDISVTQDELDELKGLPVTHKFSLPLVAVRLANFFKCYPKKVAPGKGGWAVYIYTNLITNVKYYGSTINLAQRMPHYWKTWNKENLRPILADIKKTGLSKFTLEIIEFPSHLRHHRLLLALEQYYMLKENPQNNSMWVANGSPGGMQVAEINREKLSKPLFMYKDLLLLYKFTSTWDGEQSAKAQLGIAGRTLINVLRDNSLWLNVFTLFQQELYGSQTPQYSIDKLLEEVTLARSKWTRPPTPIEAVEMTRLSDGKVFSFEKLSFARSWLMKEQGKVVTQDTMRKRMASGVPLNGYLYKSP